MISVRTHRRPRGTIFSIGLTALLAAPSAFAAPNAPAAAGAAATPTPRVLLRNPADVPPAARAEVLAAVGAAVREAGAAAVTVPEFARVVESRADVKVVIAGARDKAKTGRDLDKQQQFADAVRSLEGSVEDFEFVGADVWLPEEVGKAYVSLGFARWHRDQSQKQKVPSKTTIAAWKRGRELAPDFIPAAPEFTPPDIGAMKKAAGGPPPLPAKPGEGLFSLGRLLGLDGIVEIKGERNGALRLRVHKIEDAAVKEFKVASRGRMLDDGAKKALASGFGFGPALPPLVAVATPAPSPSATPVTVAAAPTPTPNGKASPTPAVAAATPAIAAATPTPAPTAVAIATPRPTPKATPRPLGTQAPVPEATPEATPVPVRPDSTMFSGSYAVLMGGADHRSALYTTETTFASTPSGTSPAGWMHVWFVMKDVWAISGGGGGMQRTYQMGENGDIKAATSQEAWIHVLRSDDARGRWWIGGGASYVSEPRVTGPGGFPEVPQISRITPGGVGIAHYPVGERIMLRGRALAGIAIEGGKSETTDDKSGVGYDVRVEGSAAFAFNERIRIAAGGGIERVFTDFGDKTTAVEARRGFWLGIEAGF